ncbi:RING/FYVE/PHD-type zinc finger family protein [Prunus dulcis]|uniref:RING/FYVE/PHD-type zinc finger family protein n=1 Tax=Prunus dulcis TaxID=3755 RepID=A0A4Y1QUK5_PRUDU|nr:RING/FYVE/PHD-type zinc finger family protein [Prunus dulcis]
MSKPPESQLVASASVKVSHKSQQTALAPQILGFRFSFGPQIVYQIPKATESLRLWSFIFSRLPNRFCFVMEPEEGKSNGGITVCTEKVQSLTSEANGGSTECTEKVQSLTSEANGGNTECTEKVQSWKSEANGGSTECTEKVQTWKSEANDGSTECTHKAQCLKSEANGFEFRVCKNFAEGRSDASEVVRTYKRRRRAGSSWDSRSQEYGGADVESSSQLADQRLKVPVDTAIQNNSCEQVHLQTNSSDACSDRHWRNAVLDSMYQSLGDDEGGVQVCIREAIVHFRDIDHTTRVKESGDHDVDRHQCFFPTRSILNGPHSAANGQAGVILNGSSNKTNYPTIWRKLQGIGTNLISLAKSLSDMSRSSYKEQVGGSVRNTFEGGKDEFYACESDFHTKLEQNRGLCCAQCIYLHALWRQGRWEGLSSM